MALQLQHDRQQQLQESRETLLATQVSIQEALEVRLDGAAPLCVLDAALDKAKLSSAGVTTAAAAETPKVEKKPLSPAHIAAMSRITRMRDVEEVGLSRRRAAVSDMRSSASQEAHSAVSDHAALDILPERSRPPTGSGGEAFRSISGLMGHQVEELTFSAIASVLKAAHGIFAANFEAALSQPVERYVSSGRPVDKRGAQVPHIARNRDGVPARDRDAAA